MSATNIVMTRSQLKRAAGRLNAAIHNRLEDGQAVSYAWVLESLSKGIFGKPYGEARSTLLAASAKPVRAGSDTGNAAPRVMLLEFRSELILTVDGKYVTGSFPGTDLEIPRAAMRSQAENLANLNDSTVGFVELPELLSGDWETDDIIELAARLGYFTYKCPLHEQLDKDPLVIFKSAAQRWGLDGDYLGYLIVEIESGEPWRSVLSSEIAWSPDFHVGFAKHEFFFSLQDLGEAKEVAPDRWVVRDRHLNEDFEFKLIFEG